MEGRDPKGGALGRSNMLHANLCHLHGGAHREQISANMTGRRAANSAPLHLRATFPLPATYVSCEHAEGLDLGRTRRTVAGSGESQRPRRRESLPARVEQEGAAQRPPRGYHENPKSRFAQVCQTDWPQDT